MRGGGVWGAWVVFVIAAAWSFLGANRDVFLTAAVAPPAGSLAPLPSYRAAPLCFLSRAPRDSLQLLPGIGPVLAERIAVARGGEGPFTSWDDLRVRVRGIGEKTVARLKYAAEPVENPIGWWTSHDGRNLQGAAENALGTPPSR
jgi:hypothetical protein